MRIERFLAACEARTGCRARRAGSGWITRCPAHDDRRPSLSVREGDRVPVVATCFAGCTWREITAALGLAASELPAAERQPLRRRFPPSRSPEPLPSDAELERFRLALLMSDAMERLEELRGWNLDAIAGLELGLDGTRVVFPVQDEHGELVNVLRYQPNPARRFGPKLRALRGRPRDLFPGPELYPADEPLVLVEGEPDAVTGVALGLRAVGVPGVQGWRSEWAPRFEGRRVALLFDADEPGRKLARKVWRDLRHGAASVSVLDVSGLEPGACDLTEALLRRRARGIT